MTLTTPELHALARALHVPDHPAPVLTLQHLIPPRLFCHWQNGAHATMRTGLHSVHIQELCSATGREGPTGLYTALVEQAIPVLRSWGWVRAVTCEPATDFAKDRLLSRGEWLIYDDFWLWWLHEPRGTLVRNLEAARELVRQVQAERATPCGVPSECRYDTCAFPEACSRCGKAPDEKCSEDGPGLKVNTSMCPRKRGRR